MHCLRFTLKKLQKRQVTGPEAHCLPVSRCCYSNPVGLTPEARLPTVASLDFILMASQITWKDYCPPLSCPPVEIWEFAFLTSSCRWWNFSWAKKQRHYFVNKGLSSQGCGFSSSHIWMWQLDCKESWMPKNWCFWTVVLEKTLDSPLDCKEIQPVHPKGDQSWVFIGRTDVKAETPVLWPPDVKS